MTSVRKLYSSSGLAIILVLLFSALAVLYIHRMAYVHGAPEVHLSHATHDFGNCAKGQALSHEFPIENRGAALLHVYDARTSCGCAFVNNLPIDIPSGHRRVVSVGLKSSQKTGPFHEYVILNTNDPERPGVRLGVEGAVVDNPYLLPNAVYESLYLGDTLNLRVLLKKPPGVISLEQTSLSLAGDYLEATMQASTDNAIITLTSSPFDRVASYFNSLELTLQADDGADLAFDLPIHVIVRDPLSISPSALFLSAADFSRERGVALQFLAEARRFDDFTIWCELLDQDGLVKSVDTLKIHSGKWKVLVTFRSRPLELPYSSTLILSSDIPYRQRIEVPFAVTQQGGISSRTKD